jgi:hypothetical protein
LNRRARWNMEKLAAGSTLPSRSSDVATATVTGNTANAQLAARHTAQAVSPSLLLLGLQLILNVLFTGCEKAGEHIQNAQDC